MADYAIHDTTLTDISNVIRKKEGSSALIDPADYPKRINLMGMLEEKTIVSSPIADFSDGADDVPTKSLVVTVPPTLSGVSSVSEMQTGRNLLDVSTAQGTGTIWFYYDNGIKLKKGVTYTFSCGNYGAGSIAFYGLDHTTQVAYAYISASSAKVTYTPTEDVIVCPRIYQSGLTVSGLVDVMLELGSTAHAYEPYQTPTQYTASLGRTIYGGEVDIVNGDGQELVKKKTISSFSGTYGAVNNGYAYYISDADTTHDISVVNPIMMVANQLFTYGSASRGSAPTWQYGGNDGSNQTHTFILPSEYDTLAKANNFLANLETPLEVTLTLATPTDFTFEGQEIPTRLGYNAFWSDSGDTEVTYRASGTVYNYPTGEEASF